MTALLTDADPTAWASGLPDLFLAVMNADGEPVHGDLLDPGGLRPGDYILDADGSTPGWLRVEEVVRGAQVTVVRTSPGLALRVAAGRQVWGWRAVDVLAWMVPGESTGAR